ncbi:MAG: hypothetical protein GY913_24925 [Proteobacteria bacterium]|nr:hypothetical protein [Pseudomonadota bacterium]
MEAAIKKRRGWAQGQQANPKYRNEALWLIKNNALIRRTLVDGRDAYLAEIASRSTSRSLEVLSLFIKGTLAGGMLTPDAENAILKQGKTMGLQEAAIRERIELLLQKTGARRQSADEAEDAPTSTKAPFRDYYELLEVPPTATLDEIEAQHRAKYRWARSLKDKDRVTQLYADLDEAWRILKAPMRRARYDALYAADNEGRRFDANAGDVIGFLPSPGGQPVRRPPPITPPKKTAPPPIVPPRITPHPIATPTPSAGPPPIAPPTRRNAPEPAQPPKAGRREAPKPPDAVKGRTIGLGGGRRGRRAAPRLAIAGPEVITLKVGTASITHTIVIKNSGTGQMPGRITSDRDWLEVTRSRLDPDATKQEIGIVVHPRQMRRNRGTALVTLVTDHGERRAITVNVERRAASVPVLVGGAILALGGLAVGAWALGVFDNGPEDPTTTAARATLVVQVDPVADNVEVNGERIGSGDHIELTEGFPVGLPFRLTTSRDGFTSDERTVTVKKGTLETVEVRLDLSDALDLRPDSTMTAGRLDSEAFERAVSGRMAGIEGCFGAQSGRTITITADLVLSAKGDLLYYAKKKSTSGDSAADECFRRQLRATDFPLLDGDYAELTDYTFSIDVPAG